MNAFITTQHTWEHASSQGVLDWLGPCCEVGVVEVVRACRHTPRRPVARRLHAPGVPRPFLAAATVDHEERLYLHKLK